MKQLYYTTCPAGKRLDDPYNSGFGVRAVSTGVARPRWDAVTRFASCDFPRGRPRTRLVYTNTGGEKILLHSVPFDTIARKGAFFTHILIDLPEGFTSTDAILAWGATTWQTRDDGGGAELKDAEVPVGSGLDLNGLAGRLETQFQKLLAYSASAFLMPGNPRRVLLLAEPEDVAWCVFGIVKILPAALAKDLTFSTFEKGPSTAPAVRLIGSCSDDANASLPHDWRSASDRAAFHFLTGECNGSIELHPYAQFAVAKLATGGLDEIKSFVQMCDECKVASAEQLTDLYTMEFAHASLTPAIVSRLLGEPIATGRMLERWEAVERILAWALEGASFGENALAALVRTPNITRKSCALLADRLESYALNEATADADKLAHVVDKLLPIIDAKRAHTFEKNMVSRLLPANLFWPVRAALLMRFRRLFDSQSVPAELFEWLTVAQNEMRPLLALDLPERWKVYALTKLIPIEPLTDFELINDLAVHPALVAGAIEQLVNAGSDDLVDKHLDSVFAKISWSELFLKLQEKGAIPEVVSKRVLAQPALAWAHLSNRAFLDVLVAHSEFLPGIVRYAINRGQFEAFDSYSERQQLGMAVRSEGWRLLKTPGHLTHARFALDDWLPKLIDVDLVWKGELPSLQFDSLDSESRVYVIHKAIDLHQEKVLAEWIPKDSFPIEEVSSILLRRKLTLELCLDAVRQYYKRRNSLPRGCEDLLTASDVIAQLIEKLSCRDGTSQVIELVLSRPWTEILVRTLQERAVQKPQLFWPALEQILAWCLNHRQERIVENVRTLGRPRLSVCGQIGFASVLEQLAWTLLESPRCRGDDEARQFLEELSKLTINGPSEDLIAEMQLEDLLLRPAPDMLQWLRDSTTNLRNKWTFKRRKGISRILEALAGRFMSVLPHDALPVLLDKAFVLITDPPFGDRFETLREFVGYLWNNHDFWHNRWALTAVIAVALEVPGVSTSRAATAFPRLGEPVVLSIIKQIRESRIEQSFAQIYRCAGECKWPNAEFNRWQELVETRSNSVDEPSRKRGLWNRLFGRSGQ